MEQVLCVDVSFIPIGMTSFLEFVNAVSAHTPLPFRSNEAAFEVHKQKGARLNLH